MKREIFLYGHFIYGHRLGRYFRPDDLKVQCKEKQEPWGSCLLFYSVLASTGFGCDGSAISAEHRFNPSDGLANAVTILY